MVHQIPNKTQVSEYTLLQEQLIALQEKYTTVQKRNIKLEQENEVLRNCWSKAKGDIDDLHRKCNLLQHHLNPTELSISLTERSDRKRRRVNNGQV